MYHGCKVGTMVGVQLTKYITHEVVRRRSFEAISSCRGFRAKPQDFDTKKSTQASKHRKNSKNMEGDWMTSAPYDESIPYSHRCGYTWAGPTSNELMKLWQVYRKPVND